MAKRSYAPEEVIPRARDGDGENLVKEIESLLYETKYATIYDLSEAVISGGDRHSLRRALRAENDKRLKLVEAVRLAGALNMSIHELLILLGFDVQRPSVPVLGRVRHDGSVLLKERASSVTEAPGLVRKGTRAIKMRSANTRLAAWDGALFYFAEAFERHPNDWERLIVTQAHDAPHPMLGTLAKGEGQDSLIVPFGGTETQTLGRIKWSSPVLWIGWADEKPLRP